MKQTSIVWLWNYAEAWFFSGITDKVMILAQATGIYTQGVSRETKEQLALGKSITRDSGRSMLNIMFWKGSGRSHNIWRLAPGEWQGGASRSLPSLPSPRAFIGNVAGGPITLHSTGKAWEVEYRYSTGGLQCGSENLGPSPCKWEDRIHLH